MVKQLKNIQNLAGFVQNYAPKDGQVVVLSSDVLTSDDPRFHRYVERITSLFLTPAGVQAESVNQLLIVIHDDETADVYVNETAVIAEIRAKRAIKKGEAITSGDIADIRAVRFPDVEINETDKVIYCTKMSWRFGLFFDLNAGLPMVPGDPDSEMLKLDKSAMEAQIGDLYRHLLFNNVFTRVESREQFVEMMEDGWFPFVELLPIEFEEIGRIYDDGGDREERLAEIVDKISEERVQKIADRWWKNSQFAAKRTLIEAGVDAYLQDDVGGFINCFKTLSSELEGLLRQIYLDDTGKGDRVRTPELIGHIIEKGAVKAGSERSLLLPNSFLEYLENVVFANFNVEKNEIDLSRNSSSHGVAESDQYTKSRALQMILILDQLFYYA